MDRRRERALPGVRVLEIGGMVATPYCGQVLADLGADVLKLELQGHDDPARELPDRLGDQAAVFAMLNRNKRSVAVDLAHPEGREVFYRLVRTADVLLDGLLPGELDRMGAGYEAVVRQAPRILYCSITGYGQDGPYAQRPGRDCNFAAVSGLLHADTRPSPPPVPLVELAGALFAAVSILAALRARDRTGQGQHLDLSLTEAAVALSALHYGLYWARGGPPEAPGPFDGGCPGYGIYATADGRHLSLGAIDDRHWRRLCELVGRPDLAGDRQGAEPGRREAIQAALVATIGQRTRDEWVDLLADDEVCAAPVLNLYEAMHDPHLVHRGVFTALPLPGGGRQHHVAFPVRLPATPARLERPPPRKGEHTEVVLTELGYSGAEVRELVRIGAVALAT